MKLGEIIKKYRLENNLTTAELATKCNLSKGYISMLENNFKPSGRKKDITPSLEAIKKISVGTGIEFDTLLATIDGEVSLLPLKEDSLYNKLSDQEKNLLDIYRDLDDKGQHTVDTVAQMEYERVKGGSTATNKK